MPANNATCFRCGEGVLRPYDCRNTKQPLILKRRRRCCTNCGIKITTAEVVITHRLPLSSGSINIWASLIKTLKEYRKVATDMEKIDEVQL